MPPYGKRLFLVACLVGISLGLVESMGQSVCSIRNDGVILVNGKPFFPLGFYHVSWDSTASALARDMNLIADAGFNVMHASQTPTNDYGAFLDGAARRNLYVITEFQEDRLKVINRYKNKSAVLGWNIADDVDNGGTTRSELMERHKAVKSADPSHITYASGYKRTVQEPPNIGSYVDIPEVVGMQSYPISADILGAVQVTMANAVDAAQPFGRPIIGNVQSFKWNRSGTRAPTAREARNMTYQALVGGVRGIIYYTFSDGTNYLPDYADAWSELKSLVPEIRELTPALLNGKLTRTRAANGVYAGIWIFENKVYIIAVNTLSRRVDGATINLPSETTGEAKSLFPNRPAGMKVEGNRLVGSLMPEDVHVYVLNSAEKISNYSIELRQGWNLVSSPLQPLNGSIGDLLKGSAVSVVYAWDDGKYRSYNPGDSSDLSSIEAGRGYWMYAEADATLQITGLRARGGVALKSGWNLVGFNGLDAIDTEVALSSLDGKYRAVSAYEALGVYRTFEPGAQDGLPRLMPGRGYWIYMNSPAIWTLTSG
jgi:hypothetical protein